MNRLRTLDGLRGVAIAMVVAGHAVTHCQPLDAEWRGWLLAFANPGLGVRIFFALSGYLITTLLLEETERRGTVDLRAFWMRRARRILPAFLVFMASLALWGFLHPGTIAWGHWFAALTLTWNYAVPLLPAPVSDVWVLGHTWSLAVEAQFYLLWPWVLVALGPRRSLPTVAVLLALEPVIRLVSYALFPDLRGYLGIMLHTGADGLLAGCAAALLGRNAAVLVQVRRHGALVATAALLWIALGSPLAGHSMRGFAIAAGFTLDALAAAGLLLWLHHGTPTSAHAIFARGVLPALGLVSYSLYLWQQVFLHPAVSGGRILWPVGASLAAAIVSWRFVERPFLSRGSLHRAVHSPKSPERPQQP